MQFTAFDTPIGTVALVWQGNQLERVMLPEASREALLAKLKKMEIAQAEKIPAFVREAKNIVLKHLSTGSENLSILASHLNLSSVPKFHQKVYQALLKVPAGKVVTYKVLAEKASSPQAMRAVGQAMAKNRFPLLIPCHRVIQTSGALGNFSAYHGVKLKVKLLELERAL